MDAPYKLFILKNSVKVAQNGLGQQQPSMYIYSNSHSKTRTMCKRSQAELKRIYYS